jgi:hypothetical protein
MYLEEPTMTTGAWIADLIRTHQDSLVSTTAEIVRARVPEYAPLPEAAVRGIFAQAYAVFAQSLEADDIGPWRTYFQGVLGARARAGVSPAAVIATVGLVQEQVQVLAESQPNLDSVRTAEIRSILRGQANRIRLIVSELQLARLMEPPADPTA